MTPRHLLAPLFILAATAAGASAQSAASGQSTQSAADSLNLRFADGIVAIAEDQVITVDDVRNKISDLIPQMQREAHSQEDFNQKLEHLQDSVIQDLIDRVLIIKEFNKDDKRHIPEAYVDTEVAQRLNDDFDNDRSKFLAYLRARGKTISDYRQDVADDIMYDYMIYQQRKSQGTVSPVKIEKYYKENKDQFYQEDSIRMRLIQLTHNNGDSDDALLTRANDILNRYRSGERFGDLAKEFSDDSRRGKGGDWGWQKRTDLLPEFSEPLFALKKGQATSPIITPSGCFILYVEDRKYAGIQPLNEVRPQIEEILSQQMTTVALEQWKERLRRDGYIKHF
jgi:peptidyl-prolyl cis-trans isomerase SurA